MVNDTRDCEQLSVHVNRYMVSFDVESLFTNVPTLERPFGTRKFFASHILPRKNLNGSTEIKLKR